MLFSTLRLCREFCVKHLPTPYYAGRRQYRARCQYRVGTNPALIAQQGAKLVAAGTLQLPGDAHPHVLVQPLVTVIGDNTAGFQVDPMPQYRIADKVKCASLLPLNTNEVFNSAPGPMMHRASSQQPPRNSEPLAIKHSAPMISGPLSKAPGSTVAVRWMAISS